MSKFSSLLKSHHLILGYVLKYKSNHEDENMLSALQDGNQYTVPSGRKICQKLDRILRPEGTVLARDMPEVIDKVGLVARAAYWVVPVHEPEHESVGRGKILVATKKLGMLQSTSDERFF